MCPCQFPKVQNQYLPTILLWVSDISYGQHKKLGFSVPAGKWKPFYGNCYTCSSTHWSLLTWNTTGTSEQTKGPYGGPRITFLAVVHLISAFTIVNRGINQLLFRSDCTIYPLYKKMRDDTGRKTTGNMPTGIYVCTVVHFEHSCFSLCTEQCLGKTLYARETNTLFNNSVLACADSCLQKDAIYWETK